MSRTTGIETRHSRSCPSRSDGKCGKPCKPTYQAQVWDKRAGKPIKKTFTQISEAKSWRSDALSALKGGTLSAPTKQTLRAVADDWLVKAESGEVLSRRRQPYKPSVLRGYRHDLETYIYPDLGALRLSDLHSIDIQALVDRLVADKRSGSKVRNVVTPLQALFRYAKRRRLVSIDPSDDLELPEVGGTREWSATPEDAKALLDALSEEDRALWGCALYAGLRRGELRALRISNLHGLNGDGDGDSERWISVEHGWDDKEGEIAPKSKSGVRLSLLPETLRVLLAEHVKRTGRSGADFVFGRTATEPFTPSHVRKRANKAWTAAELGRVTLHECRHGHDSFLDAAGISEARADRYMGHAQNTIGDRYRHSLRGQLASDASLLDDYLTGEGAEVVAFPPVAQAVAQAVKTA